jgi:serine protease
VNPGLSPDQIKSILQSTAYDLGTTGFDQEYGHGFVMADRAVYAAAGTTPAIQLVAYTGVINFEPGITTSSFVIKNNGGSFSALGSITYSVAYGAGASGWVSGLTTTPNGTDAATIGLTINRASIADGSYTATLTLNSTNGGSVNISLTMKVLAVPPAPTFTNVFVLLINANTDAVVDQKDLTLPGRTFTFTGVAPGTYYVCAGTDLNNDGYIDDTGEYFGVYEVTAETITFSISAGQSKSGVVIPLTRVVNPSG